MNKSVDDLHYLMYANSYSIYVATMRIIDRPSFNAYEEWINTYKRNFKLFI